MKKAFLIYGITIILVFAYANMNGWTVSDSFSSGKWGPHVHTIYHK